MPSQMLPLEVTGYRLLELHVQPRPSAPTEDRSPSSQLPGPGVQFEFFTRPDQKQEFAVSLRVEWWSRPRASDESIGDFRHRVHLVGFFRLAAPLETEGLPDVLAVNGLTILYGIIRGIVATTAGWTSTQQPVLPTVYFSPLVAARREAARSEQQLPGSAAKPQASRIRRSSSNAGMGNPDHDSKPAKRGRSSKRRSA
jgi:preprotein translocase subunit SecB